MIGLQGRVVCNSAVLGIFSSQIIGLVEGLLTDETTVGQALQHGDFGLGTLNKASCWSVVQPPYEVALG